MSNVRDLILKIKKLQELAAQEANRSAHSDLQKSPLVGDYSEEIEEQSHKNKINIKQLSHKAKSTDLNGNIIHSVGNSDFMSGSGEEPSGWHYITHDNTPSGEVVSYIKVTGADDSSPEGPYISQSFTDRHSRNLGLSSALRQHAANHHGKIYSDTSISLQEHGVWVGGAKSGKVKLSTTHPTRDRIQDDPMPTDGEYDDAVSSQHVWHKSEKEPHPFKIGDRVLNHSSGSNTKGTVTAIKTEKGNKHKIKVKHDDVHESETRKVGHGGKYDLWQHASYWKPESLSKDAIPGGLADQKSPSDFDSKELEAGIRVEMEHTSDPKVAQEIAMDHLSEDPLYYQKLKTIENKPLEKGARGDWKKEGYTFEHKIYNAQNPEDDGLGHRDDMQSHRIHVFDKNGKPAGSFSFHQWLKGKNKGTVQPWHADVKPQHRRKGIASEAYKMVERHTGTKMSRGDFQSPAAKKLWSASDRKFGKTEVIISIYEEESLEKAEEFPTGPKQTHSTKGYQSARWNNEWVWQHGPEIASNHDRYINDPKLIQSMINKMPTPQHKKAMEVVIQRIQNDPNRHIIPTHDRQKNRHVLRARHLKSLLLNDDNFNIDTSKPNQLKITAKQRHGLATGPTDFTFNIKESPNVQKSIRDDAGRDSLRGGSLRPGPGHDLEPGRDQGSNADSSGPGSNPGRRNAELNLLQHLLEDNRPHWSKAYHDHKHLTAPYAKEDHSKYLMPKAISDIMVRHSGSNGHESLHNRNSPEGQLAIKMLEEGQLRYHPKLGFLMNNFRPATEQLQRSENAPIRLIHFSRAKGLKSIDPEYMGTGTPSQETRHGVPEVRRSYFYRADSEPEHLVTQGAVSKYHVTLPETHKLYDLANDHEGHIKAAVEANNGAYNSDMVLGKIRDAGYHGFYNSKSSLPNVVAMFHSTPVHREEMP